MTFSSSQASNLGSSALYTVTIKNLGTQQLPNVFVSHGPAPFGAVFDPVHSSTGCYQNGQNVQCNHTLNAGETKTLSIVYTVDNTAHCRLAPALQSVTTTGAPQGSAVTSTVQCEVKSGDALATTFASMSSSSAFSSSYSSSFASTSLGLPIYQTTSSDPALDAAKYEDCKGFKEDYKDGKVTDTKSASKDGTKDVGFKNVGYKPYDCPRRPRTGAATEYFLGTSKSDFVTSVHTTPSGPGMMPVFVMSLFSILVLAVLLKLGFSQ